ncbi:MAG: hypothetical protein DI629_10095 [Mesorhizobium amorphae]|nr:MAG: hypothetical protein DI629_10095 [Mesorhizobium amorphae]
MGMDREKEAWFVYERRVGEISAQPANAKGWLALIGCIGATIGGALAVFFAFFPRSPLVAGLAMAAVITGGVGGTIWLAVAKGRNVSSVKREGDA